MNILFIGDSLTRGYDVPYGEGWVELVIEELKAYQASRVCNVSNGHHETKDYHVRNAGVDGATLQAIYNNLQRVCEGDSSYDLIFLMGGTNDILRGRSVTDCLQTLKKCVAYIQARGATSIIGIPPYIDFDPDGANAVVQAYGAAIKEYAKAEAIEVIDFYEALSAVDARQEIIFAGDVHPNSLGYYYMYKAAWPMIAKQVEESYEL